MEGGADIIYKRTLTDHWYCPVCGLVTLMTPKDFKKYKDGDLIKCRCGYVQEVELNEYYKNKNNQ